jgi:exosortase A-associated hydrolase 1
MTIRERAVTFDCEGETLLGILSEPDAECRLGLLVIVGGPQYRVGSHRQFLLLARRLAEDGIPVMRFDYRGMGDSGGAMRSFEDVIPDIGTAIDAFMRNHHGLDRVVLWGLCDAASAALLYWRETQDPRVAGMVLLNPWVRSEATLAVTHVKHYYGKRLLERDFWAKLAKGRVDAAESLRSFASTVAAAVRGRNGIGMEAELGFQDRMAQAMGSFSGPILLVLSGRDLTAKEFLEYAKTNSRWRGVMQAANVERNDLPDADHTFSTAQFRRDVEAITLRWIKRRFVTG